MSTSEDMRWENVEIKGVSRPPKLLYSYLDSLWVLCQRDPKAWITMLRVAQFIDAPSKMFGARMVWGALRVGMTGGKKTKKNKAKTKETNAVHGEVATPALGSLSVEEIVQFEQVPQKGEEIFSALEGHTGGGTAVTA